MKYEDEITQLIANSGMAKSYAMEAIFEAKKGNFEKAYEVLDLAKESFLNAHNIQTKLIKKEIEGSTVELNLLMVHAQDHLMMSMVIRDLAVEIVELYKAIN